MIHGGAFEFDARYWHLASHHDYSKNQVDCIILRFPC